MQNQSARSAIVALFAAMISIQFGASLTKQIFPVVGPVGAAMLRLAFASLILICIWRPFRVKLTRQAMTKVIAYGASLGAMNALFYLAIERIPLGIAVALEFIGPLTLAVVGSKRTFDIVWAVLAALGIYLIVPDISLVESVDPVGVVLALAAGACWASYIVFGKQTAAHLSSTHAVTVGMVVAAAVVFPFALVFCGGQLLRHEAYPLAFAVAALSSALPYSLEMFSLRAMPMRTFSILMSLEPVFAIIFGITVLGEILTWSQWAAIACIVVASAGSHLHSEKSKAE